MPVGKKVRLRPVEEGDLDQLARWRNDPRNLQYYFSPFLVNLGAQKKWYEDLLSNPNKVLFIVETLDGLMVGMIGVDHIDWLNQRCEGGPIVIDPDQRSHGYAEEALELLLEYTFNELNLHRFYVYSYSFNPVIEFMKWFGFMEEGILRKAAFTGGEFHDVVLMALLREDWQSERRVPHDK
jgi:RimJ/RimL family protein N-acetyltransferase